MHIATTCKFCKIPITVHVDNDYAKLGDPYKLLPLACCNRCADLRVSRRVLEKKIGNICTQLMFAGRKVESAARDRARTGLTHWTKEYAKLIAKWHKMDGLCWDEAVVDQLMEKPETWGDVLGRLWTMFKDSQASRQPDLNGV